MTASVVFSSISGGLIGLGLALSAGFGLVSVLASYSGGGVLATLALVAYHMQVTAGVSFEA